MSIQPLVNLPGVSAPKLSTRREIFLHPDKVTYRNSNRFLHKYAKDWEDTETPNTLKAGTLLALRKIRFDGEPQAKLLWFPFILTSNHTSGTNVIVLPEAFKKYAYMFSGQCIFTKFQIDNHTNHLLAETVVSNGSVASTPLGLEIYFHPSEGVNGPNWADASVLAFWGVDGGPVNHNDDPFDYVAALSVLPGDTLVSDNTHLQLHHYPWSGIVKGDMLYPRHSPAIGDFIRNLTLKKVLKAAASVGLSGLLIDEVV
jgi:hypothetical protein